MSCKLDSTLYKSLKNDSNKDVSSRADVLWAHAHTPGFKSKFGDWEAINQLSGEGDAHTSRFKGRVDKNGEPTIKAFLETLNQEDKKIENFETSALYLEHEAFKPTTTSKIVQEMQGKVIQRIRRLQQTKMASLSDTDIEIIEAMRETASEEEFAQFQIEVNRRAYLEELKELRAALETQVELAAVKTYLETVDSLMSSAEAALSYANAFSVNNIAEYNTRLSFFAGLEDIIQSVDNDPALKEVVSAADSLTGKKLDYKGLSARKVALETKFNTASIDAIAEKWGNVPGKMTAIAIRDFGNAFTVFSEYERNSNLKGKELKAQYKKDKAAYIANLMEKSADDIRQQEVDHIKQLLSNDPKDLGKLHSIILDARNMNNDLISMAVELLDIADYNVMRTTVNKATELHTLWKEFIKGKSTTDQRSLYDSMIAKDKDGKTTKYLVDRIGRPFWEARAIVNKARLDAKKEHGIDSAFYKEANKVFKTWMDANTVTWDYKTNTFIVKEKWLDSQYDFFANEANKENADYKMYWFFRGMISERDRNYPMLSGRGRGMKLPAIQKTLMETAFEDGVTSSIARVYKDTFKITGEDIDYHVENNSPTENKKWYDVQKLLHTSLDEYGKVQENIPVYYRKDDIVPVEEQSFDLASILLMDYWGSVNFVEKSMVAPELEVLRGAVGSDLRKASPNYNGKRKAQEIALEDGSTLLKHETVGGKQSNTYFALESLISARLYGVKQLGSAKANKRASAVMAWTGNVMLMLNAYSAIASVNQASTMLFIESGAGLFYGVDFGGRDAITAIGKYGSDTANGKIFADIGRIRPQAKTNLLGERFQAMQDWSVSAKRFMAATGLSQNFDAGALHGFHGMGEHYVQHLLMYSYMNAAKIKNSKGEYINKEGKAVESRDRAMSMDEMYETVEGKLEVRKGIDINSIELKTGRTLDISNPKALRSAEFKVKDALLELNYYMNGNYDSKNNSHFQRTIAGKAVLMMRKWLGPGVLKRYRGISQVFTNRDDLTSEDLYYSRHSEDMSYGQYTETIRYITSLGKSIFSLGSSIKMQDNWHQLSDREKAAIHRTVSEAVSVVMSFAMSALALGIAVDEDDEVKRRQLMYLAFYSRRLYSELSFYMWPLETFLILKNPAASISMLEGAAEVLAQLGGDIANGELEIYKRGKRKGRTKLGKEFRDILPMVKQLDRDIESSLKYLKL